ncbi:EscR/YscR/HrcR family type III secretion system export apparatus protein [Salipiger pallidus]|uniref:EscR/YscR/HrcR family type III secretion system export apparatus protein n=1 Tax=Salipiger pallidus TaxID=1775170 RepID=A0A8J2ZNA8_9RHOB|nr:EscR/YscR/HrcR family type III secretion system export apparatus protein [Salipiger pallidus]GGG84103.1 EscR/YscR/HrcR family type III secretion system export apparatus protein [Salipiger pallidus]
MGELTSPLIIGFIGGFFLLAVLTLTSFIKLSVVFMILRNALGLQQVPSNMIVMALAVILSVFISMPVLSASLSALAEVDFAMMTPERIVDVAQVGIAPFQTFLAANIDPEQLDFFVGIANEVWRGSGLVGGPDDFVIQVPAFMLSELTRAFEIGFLLYLPFVAVDLAVTGILMAMGMQQVQPNIISVPFKLLIFVVLNGWLSLIEGLLTSYAS